MKLCIKCNKIKNMEKFDKRAKSIDGRKDICKDCKILTKVEKKNLKNKKFDNIWRINQTNKEKLQKIKEINKTHKKNDMRVCKKCEILKPMDGFIKKISKYTSLNYRGPICKKCHSEKQNKYMKKRRDSDIYFKLKCYLRSRITNTINQYIKKGIKEPKYGSAVKDLGCSIEDFCKHIERLWKKGMTWENYGNKNNQWSLDHIFPLASFDLTNKDQFIKANHYTNLQPLWHIENLKKNDRY